MGTRLVSLFKSASIFFGVFLTTISAAIAQGQIVGALDGFATDNNGTPVQIGIASAIQRICPGLVGGVFGGLQNVLDAPDSPDKDLTLRCNELVLTAVDFNDPNASPSRSLGYTDPNDLLAALQQVTGEEIAAQNTMTVRASNSQFSNIAARLGALRLAAAGAGTTGPATAVNFDFDGININADAVGGPGAYLGGGAAAGESGSLKRAGFFINGSYNTGERDASALENGFDFDMFGVTAGFDYRFDSGVLGVSVGYDDFSSEFSPSSVVSGGDIEASGFSGSLFGLLDLGNFFIDGIATFGALDYDIDRILEYSSANNDPNCQCPDQNRTIVSASDGDHTSISVNAGWQWYANEWLIQPTIGLSVRNYKIDGYTEEDSLPTGGMTLRYGDQDIDSMQSVVGIQISKAINRDFGVLRPWFGVEWYHEFEDDQSTLDAKYAQEDVLAATANPALGFSSELGVGNCLSCFSLASEAPDTDFGVIGAGLSFVFPNFVQLLFYYEGLVGYEDLTSNAFTVNFRSQF
ncbi:MAG: autotransporter outer membrane beta-barrel domain-containing protein [Pseudomonadota bacterium]